MVNRRMPPGFYLTSYTRLAVNGVRKITDLQKCSTEAAAAEMNLTLADLQHFYDQRGVTYKDEYATLGVKPDCTAKQLANALAAKVRATREWGNPEDARRHCDELERCHALLVNFLRPFMPVAFHDGSQAVKFIWRELIGLKLREFSAGIGETHYYDAPKAPDSNSSFIIFREVRLQPVRRRPLLASVRVRRY
jgi:hypothetical protein